MNIDKKSFLILATAIAATGCMKQTEETQGEGGTTTTTSGEGGEAGSADGGGDQGGHGGEAGGGGGTTCDDSVGTPGECSTLATSCSEGFDQVLCEQAKVYFKPAVAEASVACMLALESSATCTEIWACRNDALANACDDDTADALCTALIADCAATSQVITEQECHDLVDGMAQAGRDAVEAQCGPAAEGMCFQGIYTTLGECVDNLF